MAAVATLLLLGAVAWDPCLMTDSAQCLHIKETGVAGVNSYAISHSPDGTKLAVGFTGRRLPQVWSTVDGSLLFTVQQLPGLPAPDSAVSRALQFSPDGSILAMPGNDKYLRVWSGTDGSLLAFIELQGQSWTLSFSPDGQYLVVGEAGVPTVYRVADWSVVTTYTGHTTTQTIALAFSSDSLSVASSTNGRNLEVWRAADGVKYLTLTHPTGCANADSVDFSPDGTMIAIGCVVDQNVNKVRVYRKTDGFQLNEYTGGRRVRFSPDGSRLLSASTTGEVYVHRIADWSLDQTLSAPTQYGFMDLDFSPDGAILTTMSYNKIVRQWWYLAPPTNAPATIPPPTSVPETMTPVTIAPTAVPTAAPTAAPLTTDAPATPCSADTFVRACSPDAGSACLLSVYHPSWGVHSVAYSQDGARLAAGGSDSVVRVFDAATGHQQMRVACVDFVAHSVAFSPDGTLLAAGGVGGRAVVCDAATGALLAELSVALGTRLGPQGVKLPVRRVSFSHDGQLLLAATEGDWALRVFDRASGWQMTTAIQKRVRDAVFAPVAVGANSDSMLATAVAAVDEGVQQWRGDHGGRVDVPIGSDVLGDVVSLAYTADAALLARGYSDGTVRVRRLTESSDTLTFQLPSGVLRAVAAGAAGLTAAVGLDDVVVRNTSLSRHFTHHGLVHAVALSPDGTRVATAGADGLLMLWSLL